MNWLAKFLGEPATIDPDYSATIEKIEVSLEGMPETEAKFLACVALLAARIANADENVSEGEKQRILEALQKHMHLDAEKAKAVAAIAIESELADSIEHHLTIRKLNEVASREQKLDVIRTLFHVACDEDISELESDKIGTIASALVLPRSDFIAIRSEYREHRALLKNLPKK